jgi:hypothetical protein
VEVASHFQCYLGTNLTIVGWHTGGAKKTMCSSCDEIDKAIARYRWLKAQILDQLTHQSADKLVMKLQAEKRELHPKAKE